MRNVRNPFRMRASEHIASDDTFLRLFGAGVLDMLPEENEISRPMFIRSAPGGGKTSLLRVFTPRSLQNLHASRRSEEHRELYSKMKALGTVGDNGPQVLGVMLSCGKNYASLDDLTWDRRIKERLFFAFVNCRVLLSAMRSILQLHNLQYPQQIHRLNMAGDPDVLAILGLPPDADCCEIFDWARQTETDISRALDSLEAHPTAPPGHPDLSSLQLIGPSNLLLDGEPVVTRVFVMFDDVHKLASSQRRSLGQSLSGMRQAADVWLAERLEALTSEELLEVGAKRGRDYRSAAPTLELFWRKYPRRFERTVQVIADKRVREAQPTDIDSFASCIQSSIETPDLKSRLKKVAFAAEQDVRRKWGDTEQFRYWLAMPNADGRSDYDRAVAWQTVDILISRESRKAQPTLGFALGPEELRRKNDSSARTAAELFLAKQFRLPYYFGFAKLASLASSNIEQFLATAGELFEESSSASILNKPYLLSVQRQHDILKRTAKQWWEQDVLRSLPVQANVRNFVESIGKFSQWETYRPNAPYAPGVTGVSITMAERDRLRDEQVLVSRGDLKQLAEVISICLAHNILEAELDRSQGYERRMILYLNRILCCHFDLPLQYGGWRPRRPGELSRWTLDVFRPPTDYTGY